MLHEPFLYIKSEGSYEPSLNLPYILYKKIPLGIFYNIRFKYKDHFLIYIELEPLNLSLNQDLDIISNSEKFNEPSLNLKLNYRRLKNDNM